MELKWLHIIQSLSSPVKDLIMVMCLYTCSRPFNAKNMTFKEMLMWTERDSDGERNIDKSKPLKCVQDVGVFLLDKHIVP